MKDEISKRRSPVATVRSKTLHTRGPHGSHGRGVASIHDAVKDFMRASGFASRNSQGPLYQAFIDAAGERFARRARPVRFARGELVVEVDSAAHLQELQSFLGGDIRSRANQILGREEIRRLTFRLKR